VSTDVVERLIEELDKGFFLKGVRFERERERIEHLFEESPVRPASHAGGAYHDDPSKLARYLDENCLAAAPPNGSPNHALTGLVAPHIDPWRGAIGYGRSYGALRRSIHADADTFVVFGTSHAPMREPFSICPKSFATPLGDVAPDDDACHTLAKAARFDPHADMFNHKREHSIEFQVLFLKHVLGDRPIRIVPILAGLGRHQARATDPSSDVQVESFLDAVRELVAKRPGRVVVVAGADLAHVGPRFGDAKAFDTRQRRTLEERDRDSLRVALPSSPGDFWSHVVSDLDERRVCGLAPIYSLLRVVDDASEPAVVHYEQTIDDDDGSIVSHAGVSYHAI
jgi:MEMO1 family protein